MRLLPLFFAFAVQLLLSHTANGQVEVEEIDMIAREEWQAEPPKMEVTRHIPRMITIHHTGTFKNKDRSIKEKLQALQKFSYSEGALGDGTPKKPWPDVPYHFYIAVDGSVAEGRELQYQGDSNTDYDLDGHALIVVEGNFNEEKINEAQVDKLEKLVLALAEKYKVTAEAVSGHKDQAKTTCPGTELYRLLPGIRKKVEELNNPRVKIGAEQLLSPAFAHLVEGKRVGLVTNHTGILPDGTHLIDLLNNNPHVDLKLLFGPEHGLRGEEDTHVADETDQKTKLPIISLYGKTRKPTPEMLEQVDVLVFDIQDVGARYYTYIKTMLQVQEAAAENNIPFIVLDRPNALSANYVDGPVGRALDPETGVGVIPVTHGMTVGELALMYNGEREQKRLKKADLTVIPVQNYKRHHWYDETGLPWIKPSPNMLSLQTAIVYPATCLLEGTNYSEARGTMYPFEHFGAPWVKGHELADQLNSYKMEGVEFRPVTFVPDSIVDGIKIYPPKFLGEQVNGVKMMVTDRDKFQSAEAGIYILHALKTLYPENFKWRQARIDGLLGTSEVRELLDAGNSPEDIILKWKTDLESFRQKRARFLLY
ncbi:exo-beta-N-acetylmuramidase NamZ domain-containing protein [Salinimicrobium terrae]|uniref:exo-beta-N-acetylmuramidase NamZ domain-containing protein n=1 Tax=Salinimicrobium terrae TaxID=470866 RepID=UPI00040A38CB|nr:exo-beta-N-acetylmuramidase NamZ domain-containing protein [Salinimicrobium terrae]